MISIPQLYTIFRSCSGVTTDSRSIKGGELFFALKGENFDGNEYALKALECGASYAVVNADSAAAESQDERLIKVNDTLKTLQELARWHRSMTFVGGKPLTVIALTGTNGKTTTKELIRQVLSVKYKVTATEGNLNNSIGVPLTLLKINSETQIAVVEMGASHPGDIKELVDIALPNYGLITNVGKAHLLGFGDFEGVMRTKGELYDYLRRTADKAFINADNPFLCRMADDRNLKSDPERPYSLLIPYGVKLQGAQIMESDDKNPFLRMTLEGRTIQTNLIGAYNADNVMAAICIGKEFGINEEDAAKAIEGYIPSNNRSQMTKTDRNTLIIDAYNANPTSMEAALDNFSRIRSNKKALMLGDMLELGVDSEKEHKVILDKALQTGAEEIYVVGNEFGKIVGDFSDERIRHLDTSAELASRLETDTKTGYTILIKGSRGIKMEKVVEKL